MDNNANYDYENEISLKELITVLIDEKKFIAFITIFFIILSGIYSFFIVKPVYEANSSIIIKIPETVKTKYGDYNPITTNSQDLIPLIKETDIAKKTISDLNLETSPEGFINSVKYSTGKDSEMINISFNWGNGDIASNVLAKHIENYREYLNREFSISAINHFKDNISKNTSILEEELKKLEADLKFNRDSIASIDKHDMVEYQKINNSKDGLIIAEVSNPTFTRLMDTILTQETRINQLRNQLSNNKVFLKELEIESENIISDESYIVNEPTLKIMNNSIKTVKQAYSKTSPIKPNKKLNIAIAAVLGLMMGVFVAFFKSYWKNN